MSYGVNKEKYYKFLSSHITEELCHFMSTSTKAANTITVHTKFASSSSYIVTNTQVFNAFQESVIRDSMQQGVVSPLFDERLLYSDDDWRAELSKKDLKYIKTPLFPVLFGTSFDDYAKGIQSTEEKINLVHSRLKSIYREEMKFLEDRKNENI